MNKRDNVILQKMLKEISVLQKSVKGHDIKSFKSNDDKKRATAMTLINLGELARHLTPDFKIEAAHIPFKQIIGLRDIAAHGYYSLDFEFIWNTVTHSVPELKSEITKILARGV